MSKKKDNPSRYVTKTFCDERFLRVMDKLEVIDQKLDQHSKTREQEGRDWRMLGFAVLGSLVSAVVTAVALHCLGL